MAWPWITDLSELMIDQQEELYAAINKELQGIVINATITAEDNFGLVTAHVHQPVIVENVDVVLNNILSKMIKDYGKFDARGIKFKFAKESCRG